MKTTLILTLMSSLTCLAAAPQAIPDQYIVVLKPGAEAAEVARAHGLGMSKQWKHALNGFVSKMSQGQLKALKGHAAVAYVESDLAAHVLTSQTLPTGIQRIGRDSIGADLRVNGDVAVLDTGIDPSHPDLNVVLSINFSSSATANDLHGHGSHVAGTIGALDNGFGVVGVAPGVRLWSVKVLDDSGSGSISSIISGVDYVTQNASKIAVANMSLGGSGVATSLRQAISNSVAHGVVYVVAAGNSAFEVLGADLKLETWDDFFPAAYPEVMTVSALADTDGLSGGNGATNQFGADDTLATFSNFSTTSVPGNPVQSPGIKIDVAAPGVDVYSTYKSGGYATMSGTSMAAPHVTGAVALWVAAYGRAYDAAGVARIRQDLVNLSEPQSDWGKNKTTPYSVDTGPEGLLDVRSIPNTQTNLPGTSPSPTPTPTPTPNPPLPLSIAAIPNKGNYQLREKATLTSMVTGGGMFMAGVTVTVTVNSASGKQSTMTATTDAAGKCAVTMTLARPFGVGTYNFKALAAKSGYVSAEGLGSFTVSR